MLSYMDVAAEFVGTEEQNYYYQLQLRPLRSGGRPGFTIKGTVSVLGVGEVIELADARPVYGKFSSTDGLPSTKELERLLIEWIELGEL